MTRPARVMARDVAEYVCSTHQISWHRFVSDDRSRAIARPRQIAMFAIRELCPHMSFPAIGRLLGGRDHTTILHGVRKVQDLILADRDVALAVRNTLAHFNARPSVPDVAFHAQQFAELCASYRDVMRRAA